MNTKIVLASCIAALSGLAGFATTAHAGTDFRINLNLGLPRPPAIIVSGRGYEAPAYGYTRVDSCDDRAPSGYWKEITVKTWVPERWIVTYDRRGREIRSCSPGYFTYRTDRVWVDTGRSYSNNNYYARR